MNANDMKKVDVEKTIELIKECTTRFDCTKLFDKPLTWDTFWKKTFEAAEKEKTYRNENGLDVEKLTESLDNASALFDRNRLAIEVDYIFINGRAFSITDLHLQENEKTYWNENGLDIKKSLENLL